MVVPVENVVVTVVCESVVGTALLERVVPVVKLDVDPLSVSLAVLSGDDPVSLAVVDRVPLPIDVPVSAELFDADVASEDASVPLGPVLEALP